MPTSANIYYPRLIRRVQAVLIDEFLIFLSVFLCLIVGTNAGVQSVVGKVMLIAVPIFILDPVLTSFTGGTIGHHLRGVRVAKLDGVTRINIFAATLRFVVKIVLGWLSFLIVPASRRHQAIHDKLVKSVVVLKTTDGLPSYDVLQERSGEDHQYLYPSKLKRIFFIGLYTVTATLVLGIGSALLLSDRCLDNSGACNYVEQLASIALSIVWLLAVGSVIVLGWTGRLWGARKKLLVS
ncbi:MAG: hypothetical protein RL341_1501 [Pseudomonadota bacterium]|jgi:hypothetical protein